jgi:hypothetical protein
MTVSWFLKWDKVYARKRILGFKIVYSIHQKRFLDQNVMCCWPCISIYGCNETNLMHYLSSVYSVTIPLNVSGLLVAHHQKVTMHICKKRYLLYVLVNCQLVNTTPPKLWHYLSVLISPWRESLRPEHFLGSHWFTSHIVTGNDTLVIHCDESSASSASEFDSFGFKFGVESLRPWQSLSYFLSFEKYPVLFSFLCFSFFWLKRTTRTIYCVYTLLPPDDGQLASPKHVEVQWRNKLKINSASSWFHYMYLTIRFRIRRIIMLR